MLFCQACNRGGFMSGNISITLADAMTFSNLMCSSCTKHSSTSTQWGLWMSTEEMVGWLACHCQRRQMTFIHIQCKHLSFLYIIIISPLSTKQITKLWWYELLLIIVYAGNINKLLRKIHISNLNILGY